jgi:hypothetical protein
MRGRNNDETMMEGPGVSAEAGSDGIIRGLHTASWRDRMNNGCSLETSGGQKRGRITRCRRRRLPV